MNEPIGPYLRRLRERQGGWLTQRELSRRAGVSQSTIGRAEKGTHAPSAELLRALAPHLQTSEDDLLQRAGYRAVRPHPPPAAVSPHTVEEVVREVRHVLEGYGTEPTLVQSLCQVLGAAISARPSYAERRAADAALDAGADQSSVQIRWRPTGGAGPADRTEPPDDSSLFIERARADVGYSSPGSGQ